MEGLLVVVPCGQGKVWDREANRGPTAACDAYTGAPFKVNREYAEMFGESWVILSAKFGFVPPHFLIPEPYDVTFKRALSGPISALELRGQIREQGLDRFRTIVGLGGKEYRQMLVEAFSPFAVELRFPFAGLPIGKAMRATKHAISLHQPFPSQAQPAMLQPDHDDG